jgi:CDP-paratose synthetase
MEEVFGKKINANWGGIPYRSLDTMHAVAPIARNLSLLGWRSRISLYEGICILKEDNVKYINKSGGVNYSLSALHLLLSGNTRAA